MDYSRPAPQRGPSKGKLRTNPIVKGVEEDMNDNHVRIKAIDSGRIDKVRANSPGMPITPPLPMIGKEPPQIVEQMRAGKSWDLVPINHARRVLYGTKERAHPPQALHPLRINMNFPSIFGGETLYLFDDAEFCAVLAVQKWRYYCEAQVRPALRLLDFDGA